MSIYSKKKVIYPENHRKIYEDYHGPIPVDDQGRSFEIHHIDGNKDNNLISNLVALSIDDHYKIHLEQGDYTACMLIALRMKKSADEISRLASLYQKERVENGTHPWLKENGGGHRFDPKEISDRAKEAYRLGSHVFQTEDFEIKRLSGYRKSIDNRKDNNTFHMLIDNPGKEYIFKSEHEINQSRLLKGNHPSQIKKECLHCKKIVDTANYARYHGDKCRMKETNERMA